MFVSTFPHFMIELMVDGKFNLRSRDHWSTLRSRPSRFRNGDLPLDHPSGCNRLDDPPGGSKCEIIREGIIYRGNAPLFWSLGFGGSLILSICFRFRRVSYLLHTDKWSDG
jgi:hypothetical protein